MASRRKQLAWAAVVAAMALVGGVWWVTAQGRPGAGKFADEYRYYTGPEVVEGSGQVRVIARDREGQPVPGAECRVKPLQQAVTEPFPSVGADGDWVAYNIPQGEVTVSAVCRGYVCASEGHQGELEVVDGGGFKAELTLLRGARATGRVVDAETGEPIEGARVGLPGWGATTDMHGVYTADAVDPSGERPDHCSARAEGYVSGKSEAIRFEDEKVYEVPDIRLHRGGMIVGTIVRPDKADEDEHFRVRAGTESTNGRGESCIANRGSIAKDDTFRVGALASGTYTLRVVASNDARMAKSAHVVHDQRKWTRHWEARLPGVRVEAGKDTEVGEIELELTREEPVPEREPG